MINLCVYISFTNNHSNVNHFSANPDTIIKSLITLVIYLADFIYFKRIIFWMMFISFLIFDVA